MLPHFINHFDIQYGGKYVPGVLPILLASCSVPFIITGSNLAPFLGCNAAPLMVFAAGVCSGISEVAEECFDIALDRNVSTVECCVLMPPEIFCQNSVKFTSSGILCSAFYIY